MRENSMRFKDGIKAKKRERMEKAKMENGDP